MPERLVLERIGRILHAFASLVPDDVLLIGEARRGQRLEQIPHAIALEPEGELELIGRHVL